MNVNNGLDVRSCFNKQSTQAEFHATNSINHISNTTNMFHNSHQVKRHDFKGVSEAISNAVKTEMTKNLPDCWDKVQDEMRGKQKWNQTRMASIILSPFTFSALETVRVCEIEALINIEHPNWVRNTAVRAAFNKRFKEEADTWECASKQQIRGVELIYKKYRMMSCCLTLLILMRLDPDFAGLRLSNEQFRSALNSLKVVKPMQTEIDLSDMIANTHIPEDMDQWYEANKGLFRGHSLKGIELDSRLRSTNFPSNMTIEQLQKLLLREGHCDMTCYMIYLGACKLGIEHQPYHSPITILRDQQHREVIMLSDDSSDESSSASLPPLSPVITQPDGFLYDDTDYYNDIIMYKSDTAALPVTPDELSIFAFDTVKEKMVVVPIDQERLRVTDFIMYELEN